MFSVTLDFLIYKIYNQLRKFSVEGENFHYFTHRYNTTWCNERAVEIPFLWSKVQSAYRTNHRVLEVGNVFSHYFPIKHEVVDKYEQAPGVKNIDIVEFASKKKYDLIVSVSTLEHVGFDEIPKDKNKIIKAIDTLKSLLKPGGELWFSCPVGHTKNLDAFLKNKKIKCDELFFLKRITIANDWVKTDSSVIGLAKYNEPFGNANAIYFAKIES